MKARTSCLYAESGVGKTTQLYFMALWVWFTFGLKTRLISYDGKYDQFQLPNPRLEGKSLISSGIVQLFDANVSPTGQMLADTRKLSEGYWPRRTKDGKMYFVPDENCMTDWDKEKIGLYAIDGISALSDIWLVYSGDNEIGYKSGIKSYEEGGYEWKGTQDGHYRIVQNELVRCFKGLGQKQGYHNLPVRYVMTTALVERGVENFIRKRTRRVKAGEEVSFQEFAQQNMVTLYGPKAAGQALTSQMPGWFSDCMHLDRVLANIKGREEPVAIRVAYYEDHEHLSTGMPYKCRIDLLPEDVPKLRERFKGGFIPLEYTRGIDKFYEFILGEKGKEVGG